MVWEVRVKGRGGVKVSVWGEGGEGEERSFLAVRLHAGMIDVTMTAGVTVTVTVTTIGATTAAVTVITTGVTTAAAIVAGVIVAGATSCKAESSAGKAATKRWSIGLWRLGVFGLWARLGLCSAAKRGVGGRSRS